MEKTIEPGIENRKYVRIPSVLPVEIKFVDKETLKPLSATYQCFTKDVSKGGMCLDIASASDEIKHLIKSERAKLSISIKPSFSKRPIFSFANFVWHKFSKEDTAAPHLLLGIMYENMIPIEQERLFAFAKSIQRRPYIIAGVISLLLAFSIIALSSYYIVHKKNQSLATNVKTLSLDKMTSEQQLQYLTQKDRELTTQINEYKTKTDALNIELNKLANNLTDEVIEEVLQGLRQENSTLKENVSQLTQELTLVKKELNYFKNIKFYLSVKGNEDFPELAINGITSIITLNNNNVLVGDIINQNDLKITLRLANQNEMDIHLTEIKNINTVKLLDSRSLTGQVATTEEQTYTEQNQIQFLQKIEYDSFVYFLNEVNKSNGLVKDTSAADSPCSISVVGFALTAYCIAESKGWMTYDDAYNLTLITLKTFYEKLDHNHGFFYHFIDMKNGKRAWNSEISSFDTAVFISGALLAGQYFKNTAVSALAKNLYERIDWTWMTNNSNFLVMGWKPEIGFMPYSWDSFNEGMLAYILAIGSPTHPLDPKFWSTWQKPKGNYKQYSFIYSLTGSLLMYQYPHVWINFKDINDHGINYWNNLIAATNANRQFCIDKNDKYKTYGENSWGITACLGPKGYKGYSALPGAEFHDGTVAPSAVAGSLPMCPDIAAPTLLSMYNNFNTTLYSHYGFKDSYNLDQNWVADKYLGINQGLTLIMIENYFTQFVWKLFMDLPCIQKWKDVCISDKK